MRFNDVSSGFDLINSFSGGRVTFRGELIGPGVTRNSDAGIWSGAPGEVELVIREGDPAPGLGDGVTLNFVGSPITNDAGNMVFAITDSTNLSAIITGAVGELTLAVGYGDAVALDPLGRVLTRFPDSTYSINSNGQISFIGETERAGVPQDRAEGIFSGTDRSFVEVARVGNTAPGAKEGVLFDRFSDGDPVYPIINNRGDVVFRSTLSGPGVLNSNENEGFWTYRDDELHLVVLEDSEAPGTTV